MIRPSAHFVRSICIIVMLAGCATTAPTTGSRTMRSGALTPMARYFDTGQIRRSGAATAWDALRLVAPHHAVGDVGPFGVRRPPGTSGSGLGGAPRPRVIVDGFVLPEPDALRAIPAADIIDIQLIGALDAAIHFGDTYGGGAIVIRTTRGSRRD